MFTNLSAIARENRAFRRVVDTSPHGLSQLALMSLAPRENIGLEVHPTTLQVVGVVEGTGIAVINSHASRIQRGDVVVVEPGMQHDFLNTSMQRPLQLWVLYVPALHPPHAVEMTAAEARAEEPPTSRTIPVIPNY